jgi:hypothetical protein
VTARTQQFCATLDITDQKPEIEYGCIRNKSLLRMGGAGDWKENGVQHLNCIKPFFLRILRY